MLVVLAVPMGGLIRLRVPAVELAVPWPTCVPAELAPPRPMPALLLVVEPVEPVVELDVPPSRPEAEVAEAPLVLVPYELEVNPPSTVADCVAPETVEFDVALATWAFADAPIREQATAAEAAMSDIFMVNTSR
jgi:hypothetical protein